MSQPFNQQAASLVEETVGLIKQVLIKHSTAVLEEMYEQITSRNERIKDLMIARDVHRNAAHEADMRTQTAVRAEKQAIAERDALLGDKDEYCKVLKVLGMEEEGSPVEEILAWAERLQEYKKITDELRDLLRTEFLRHDHLELPWKCVESDCPRFGKSLYLTGCNCVHEFKAKHIAEVKQALAKELGM